MFFFLSKLLPLFVYPVGLAAFSLLLAIWLQRRGWSRAQTAVLLAGFLVIFLGGNKWVTTAVMRPLEWRYLPPEPLPQAPAIVLLGGATRSLDYPQHQVPGLNEAGERMLYAAWLYQQGVAPLVLVSGGQSPGSTTPETTELSQILQLMGVPADAIMEEGRSLNTYDNGVFTREMLAPLGIDEIVLVTSAVHMPRSVAIFENQGFTVIPAPTDYFVVRPDERLMPQTAPAFLLFDLLPDAENLMLTTRALKEYLGIAIYWLRGWL